MVHFGTSGWRGIIGRELTFRRVRIVVQAMIETLREAGDPVELIVIGFDTRLLSEKFAKTAAQLIASNRISAELAPRDVPSPVVASMVLERSAAAGITFTGSHNPPEYNGLKIYTADGILAAQKFTDRVEKIFDRLEKTYDDTFVPRRRACRRRTIRNPRTSSDFRRLIDWEAIRAPASRWWSIPCTAARASTSTTSCSRTRSRSKSSTAPATPTSAAMRPDCTSENLSRLRDVMRRTGADLGLSTDGDGDRFGILDHGARMCDSSTALAVILDYLARRRV